MIREVTMYRVECDHVGCSESPQDDGDVWAWADPDTAMDEALDDLWWYRDDTRILCRDHWPVCAADGSQVEAASST
jgi:hypothetical protein